MKYYINAVKKNGESHIMHESDNLEYIFSIYNSLHADEEVPLIELMESCEDDDYRLAYTEWFNQKSQKEVHDPRIVDMWRKGQHEKD